MSSLVVLPSRSDAFSAYRPSTNAHVDIINPTAKRSTGDKVVRLNFRPSPTPLDDHSEVEAVYASVPLILADKATPISFHRIATGCRYITSRPSAEARRLYEHIETNIVSAVKAIQKELRASIMTREKRWMKKLVDAWKAFEVRVNLLAAVFVYLDRMYCTEGAGVPSIRDCAATRFREDIWDNALIYDKTRNEFLSWVEAERSSSMDSDARADAVAAVRLSERLDAFDTLAGPYRQAAADHYEEAAKSIQNVQAGQMTGTQYVQWAVDKEEEEWRRAKDVLSSTIADEVVNIVRTQLGQISIVQTALDEAMYRADTDALTRLYIFCINAKLFETFQKALHDHIDNRIRVVISDPANDPQMIDSTLKLKRFADHAVASLFTQAPALQADEEEDDEDVDMDTEIVINPQERTRQLELEEAVRSGFKAGLSSRQNAPAEWIAKHLDAAMRKGQGSGTEEQFNALLDEILALVSFTRDKDVFRAFYASGLAKRLLLNKSASDDMERTMIIKLHNEMGEEFTSGDVMMKDLQLSETLIKSYQSARAKNPDSFRDRTDFTATVLTESAWPAYPLLKDGWDFKLTPELQSSLDSFISWYPTQHQNRQLSWRHQLSTVTLTARFDSGKYEIGVSLFQAVVLLQFNEVDALDFTELKSRTGIESSELVRVLQSLAMGRKGTRVLLKRPAGKEVEPTDKFAFNKSFSGEKIKFKINQIQQDLSAEESRKTNEQVAIDRVSVLEATIVRIMKGRKKMTLQLLIDAVVTDVSKRFPPDVKEIKKRVESLIEREYLKRDENDRNTLHYLA